MLLKNYEVWKQDNSFFFWNMELNQEVPDPHRQPTTQARPQGLVNSFCRPLNRTNLYGDSLIMHVDTTFTNNRNIRPRYPITCNWQKLKVEDEFVLQIVILVPFYTPLFLFSIILSLQVHFLIQKKSFNCSHNPCSITIY